MTGTLQALRHRLGSGASGLRADTHAMHGSVIAAHLADDGDKTLRTQCGDELFGIPQLVKTADLHRPCTG